MAGFDSNTWYSIAYTSSDGKYNLGVNPDPNHPLAVYLYPTNITDTHQQFQILTAPSSTSKLPAYLFRGSNVPAEFYLKAYCVDLSDCPYKTWSGMHVVETPEDVTLNLEWTLAGSGAGDGSYHVMNMANGTSYYLDASGTTIWMNPDIEGSGLRWTISRVSAVDDTRFSTTATPMATGKASSTTAPAAATTSLQSASVRPTNATSTPSSSPAPVSSSGMSSSTKAAIGSAVGGVLFLLALGALAFYMRRHQQRKSRSATNTAKSPRLHRSSSSEFDKTRPAEMQSEPSAWSDGRIGPGQIWEGRAELNNEPRHTGQSRAELNAEPDSWNEWLQRVEMDAEEVKGPRVALHSKQDRWPVEMPPGENG